MMAKIELTYKCPGCDGYYALAELIVYEPERLLAGGRCPGCKSFIHVDEGDWRRFLGTYPVGGPRR